MSPFVGSDGKPELCGLEMDRTFIDMASGKDTHRPQLEALLAFVRKGDTVVVQGALAVATASRSP